MKNIVYSSLILILTLAVISCEDTEKSKKDNNNNAYFPNVTGTEWMYSRYDSLQSTRDTITVSIGNDTTINGTSYKKWQYNSPKDNWFRYVAVRNDSVFILDNPDMQIDQLILIPLEENKGWVNPDYKVDTSYITIVPTFQLTSNGIINDLYLIHRQANCCNDYLTEKIWFKPYQGMVRIETKHYVFGPLKNEVWELIN